MHTQLLSILNCMDIVSRIKKFMNSSQISSSQFADTCNIPRPTISQILNGRNKKISDEIIGKIHTSFPSLSMLWLMFGEGDMIINKNIEISTPKNTPILDDPDSQSFENGLFGSSLDFNIDPTENTSENLAIDFIEKNTEVPTSNLTKTDSSKQFSLNSDSNKTIVNIMVFYSDNSFESFTPANRKI